MFLEVAHPSRATEQRLEGLVSRPRPLDECAHQQIEGVRARQAALARRLERDRHRRLGDDGCVCGQWLARVDALAARCGASDLEPMARGRSNLPRDLPRDLRRYLPRDLPRVVVPIAPHGQSFQVFRRRIGRVRPPARLARSGLSRRRGGARSLRGVGMGASRRARSLRGALIRSVSASFEVLVIYGGKWCVTYGKNGLVRETPKEYLGDI